MKVGEPEVHRQRTRWVVRQGGYDAGTGRRRVKQLGTFATKREAMAQRRALAEGRADTDDETLQQFLEEAWLPSKAGRVEQSTLDQYDWAVRLQVLPLLGAVRLSDLTPEVVDGWVSDLVAVDTKAAARSDISPARTQGPVHDRPRSLKEFLSLRFEVGGGGAE